MSARINGITNTNNDVNIENNMKVLPLVREEYYLTLEAFNKLELTKDISFIGNDISFNANISISGDLIPLYNITSDLGSSSNYWSNAYIRDISISNISVSGSINIPNGSIVTSDISNLSITTDKIAEHAVTHSKIAYNAVTNINIANLAVTQAKIAHNTIQAININTSAPETWTFRNISGTYMTISGNIIPLNNVVSDLGSSSNYWRHAYIDNIDVSSHIRIGQGHFGGKILSTSTEHELIIDPHGFDFPYTGNDASGRVVILGDLIVRGNTTTINSASIDISDLILNIASNATRNNVFGTESGIELGSDKYASLLYNRVSNSWKTNIGLEISGAITLSGNLVSSSNNSQLGSSNNYWSNAYITNLNVTNFVNTIDASYLTDNTITSAKIANTSIASSKIDSSGTWTFLNIDTTTISISGNLIPLGSTSSLGSSERYWTNAYIVDLSVSTISVKANLIPLNNNRSDLGLSESRWNNLYISSIDVSGDISNIRQIIPQIANDISTSLGTSSNIWQKAFISDLSGITRINGATWPLTSGGGGTSDFSGLDINTNLIPRNPLSIDLGSSSKYWRNAYIQDLSARNISVSGSISVSGNIVPLNSNNNSDLGLTTLRWNNLFIRNIDVSGDISNVRDICNVRQIIPRPTSDISTSLGTSSNIWQRAFISDLSGITRINGATWPLTSGGGGDGTSNYMRLILWADSVISTNNGQLTRIYRYERLLYNPNNMIINNNNQSTAAISMPFTGNYIISIGGQGGFAGASANGQTRIVGSGKDIYRNSSTAVPSGTSLNVNMDRIWEVSYFFTCVANDTLSLFRATEHRIDPQNTAQISSALNDENNGLYSRLGQVKVWYLGSAGGGGGGGGTSDFSGLDISTSLIPRNPLSIDLGSSSKYWRNAYINDISAINISISGNVIPLNNNSQVPVSYNTFSVVSAQNRTLPSYIGTTSANVWLPASAYDISKVVLSNRSFIKIEVKVNYTASPEADQTLSFRVLESFNRGISFETNPVFSDISLGSSMGVTINNIYNGSYYEDISGVTLSGNIITYRLEFRRDCPVDNTIKTPYGIQQSTGNYMSLQELYRP